MKKILWLTEWFPTPFQPYSGDGIERRAKAASLYNKIFIIYVKKNPGLAWHAFEVEKRIYNENCQAFIWYYPSYMKFGRPIDFVLSNFFFFVLHLRAFNKYRKYYGKPDGIQVNVTMKIGLMALYFQCLKKINYIVVEGWSLFLPESKPGFKQKSWLFRYLTFKILKNAKQLITVSDHLGKMMNLTVGKLNYEVIPSVVDKNIFYPEKNKLNHDRFRYIHISDSGAAKNTDQILSAFKKTLDLGIDAEMIIHTPIQEVLFRKIEQLGISERVILKGEGPQSFLAESIRSSDALILFSSYETFGNVIIEAQACGLPVITSNYPTFFEIIENHVNGIIADGKDADALKKAMIQCILNKHRFNSETIAATALSKYSFEVVGKMLDKVYKEKMPKYPGMRNRIVIE